MRAFTLVTICILLTPSISGATRTSAAADQISQLTTMLAGPRPLPLTSCAPTLSRWTRRFNAALKTDDPTLNPVATFAARQLLRERLRGWVGRASSARACVDQTRLTLSALRRAEDHAVLRGGASASISARADGKIKLRSGDVLLSRGNTFVSAAIAKIGRVEGDFSHLAQVYINAPPGTEVDLSDAARDPRVFTVEAHIEVGTFTRPFADYVADANARVVLMRPREGAADAHLAAKTIFDWVRAYQVAHAGAYHRAQPTVDDNPPYDFKMDVGDITSIFCAEVVSIAQAAVGWRVPRVQTELKQNQVTEVMGITRRRTFAPSDLEVDPRFEVLAEMRNLSKLPSILRKDVVMHELYARMARGEFRFDINPLDHAKAVLAWVIRQNGLGFQDRLTKGMPTAIIALSFAIERAGAEAEALLVE